MDFCKECDHVDFKHDKAGCIEAGCTCLSMNGTTPRWWRS